MQEANLTKLKGETDKSIIVGNLITPLSNW